MKAKELRHRAKAALKGKYWWAVLAALIAALFGAASISTGAEATEKVSSGASAKTEAIISNMPESAIIISFIILIGILIIAIAMTLASGAVKLGYCRFNLNLFTNEEKPSMHILFSRTGIIWKALWMEILNSLIVAVGCMLFIIPGIIIGLGISQSEYILAENPDLKATQAIKKSWEMMKGNKWSFFCLGLSFIGWIILSAFVPAGGLFLAPYIEAANAAFYLDRTGRLGSAEEDEAKDTAVFEKLEDVPIAEELHDLGATVQSDSGFETRSTVSGDEGTLSRSNPGEADLNASRMTDEYKAWMQEQIEKRDAEQNREIPDEPEQPKE